MRSRLKIARERALLTQAQLAEKAGVAPRTIVNAEQGGNTSATCKRKILLALGIPMDQHEDYFGPVGGCEDDARGAVG